MVFAENARINRCLITHYFYEEGNSNKRYSIDNNNYSLDDYDKHFKEGEKYIKQYVVNSLAAMRKQNFPQLLDLTKIFGIDIENMNSKKKLCGKVLVLIRLKATETKVSNPKLKQIMSSVLRKIPLLGSMVTNGYYELNSNNWTNIMKYIFEISNIKNIPNDKNLEDQINNIYETIIKPSFIIHIFWNPDKKQKNEKTMGTINVYK